MKKLYFFLLFLFLSIITLTAQDTSKINNTALKQTKENSSPVIDNTDSTINQNLVQKENIKKNKNDFDWQQTIPWIIAFIMFVLFLFQYIRWRKDKKISERIRMEEETKYKMENEKELAEIQKKTAEANEEGRFKKQRELKAIDEKEKYTNDEKEYRRILKEELGKIRILGSPDIDTLPVNLIDAFVSLKLSTTSLTEDKFDTEKLNISRRRDFKIDQYDDLSPEELTKIALNEYRMLLLIGDPGSGKTTLLKYYTICLLNGEYKKLGFKEPVLPIFFPLRELEPKNINASLPENLSKWSKKFHLNIKAEVFDDWLHNRKTLVLLDGLDEISEVDERKLICKWIDNTAIGLKHTRFIVSSRWTGYRKLDGIELTFDHFRADVKDFTTEQQEDFLNKWFVAAFLREVKNINNCDDSLKRKKEQQGIKKAQKVIDFLQKPENKSVQDLAKVPMILQIMAIILKERDYLPQSRTQLYESSLKYLLDFRDTHKELKPILPAEKSLMVLQPVSLTIQEEIRKDQIDKDRMHKEIHKHLKTLDEPPNEIKYCVNLRDRAGIIADYGKDDYIFQHKSFREYLAGIQLNKEWHKLNRMKVLIDNFGKDWWTETIRFFVSKADHEIFDEFMKLLFFSETIENFSQDQADLLRTVINEAPQTKIDGLVSYLNDKKISKVKRRYIIDCLKAINKSESYEALKDFINSQNSDTENIRYAKEVIRESKYAFYIAIKEQLIKPEKNQKSFYNTFENNAEYILIPGGDFKYSVSMKNESVPDIYFAKYPVTNLRYRKFISYLEEKTEKENSILPVKEFSINLLEFASKTDNYVKYLSGDFNKWHEILRSRYGEDKKFKADDQPVIGVSWYDARAYCFWLSMLELKNENEKMGEKKISNLYRLPNEIEWEWSAGGGVREFPWGNESKNLSEFANYDDNIGKTTPVTAYPKGATPEGLNDMAGNIWEWMENEYEKFKRNRSLRGGSWILNDHGLRCSARYGYDPGYRNDFFGFRVVRSPS